MVEEKIEFKFFWSLELKSFGFGVTVELFIECLANYL